MNPINTILKNINVLNLLLLAITIFLLIQISDSTNENGIKFTISKPKEVANQAEEKAATENTATYLDYFVITDKNLFHPARKIASEAKQEQQMARPEIILYGTLITDEKKVAYIEDKKSPYSTPGRGKRQVAVNEGGMIAGYKLAKVNAESILLVHGEDKITVTLNTGKERKPGDAAAKKAESGTMPVSTTGYVSQQIPPLARPAKPYTPPLPPMPARPTLNSR